MSVRSNEMRVAILHAPGDEGLAERVVAQCGFADALVAPLSSSFAFGPHIVVVALWSARAVGFEGALQRLAQSHPSVALWRLDETPTPALDSRVAILATDSTPASIAPALRLMEIKQGRPPEVSAPRRRVKRGIAAGVLGVGIAAALGAAGAAAVMLDGEDMPTIFAAQPAADVAPSLDLRPTSQP